MGVKNIHYDEVLFSNYKYAKVRAIEVLEKHLGWTKVCKSIKDDTPLMIAAVDTLGVHISEMTMRLYHIAKVGDIQARYSKYKTYGKPIMAKLDLTMDEENRISKYKECREKALNDLKIQLLKDTISISEKQGLLEMYVNHLITIFDLQEVLFIDNINKTVERILYYEILMSAVWKSRYSAQFRTKMFSELGEYLSDYFEGVIQEGDSLEVKPEAEIREYHFTDKYKNKVFAKGLKMCIDMVGKDNRMITVKDDFTENILNLFQEMRLIKLRNLMLVPEDVNFQESYEIKILPEARRLLSICERKNILKSKV